MAGSSRLARRLVVWAPVAAYLGGISFLSHQPSLTIPGGLPDWMAHGAEYAGLGALVARAVGRSSRGTLPAWIGAAAGCGVFGVLDEIHQSFVPGRDASLHDVIADTAGAALAILAAVLIESRRRGAGAQTVEIAIYGRQGCHLCDEAEQVVRRTVAGTDTRVLKIDVDADADLLRRYGDQVPVVTVNGRRLFKLRVDPQQLRRRIDSIRQRRAPSRRRRSPSCRAMGSASR